MGLRIMKPGVVSLHHIDIVGSVKSFALVIHRLSGYTCAGNYSLSVQNTGFGSAILLTFLFWFLLTVVVCIPSWNECWRDWVITMEEKNAHCCAKLEWVSKQCLFGWAAEEGDIDEWETEFTEQNVSFYWCIDFWLWKSGSVLIIVYMHNIHISISSALCTLFSARALLYLCIFVCCCCVCVCASIYKVHNLYFG